MSAKIIAIANRKGGAGKTSATTSVSGVAASRGLRCLAIDLDTSVNLSSHFLPEIPDMTVVDTFFKNKLPIVKIRDNLDIIPSNRDLVQVEDSMEGPRDQAVLLEALKPAKEKYDYIFLDCPPDEGWVLMNALAACDFLFVPMMPDKKYLEGLTMMAECCYRIINPTRINGVFFAAFNPRTKVSKAIEAMTRSRFGAIVMNTKIRVCCKMSECGLHHQDIFTYDPKCNAAIDYSLLFDEMLDIMGVGESMVLPK